MDDLLQEFIVETRETLEALSGEIVAWESDPADRGRLDSIFRFVHTVKGSCGFLDLPRLERLSHAAEDVLAAVRAGERVPDKRLVDAVLAIVDRIGEIVEAIAAGTSLDDTSEELLLTALEEGEAPVPAASGAPAQPAMPRTPTRSVRLAVDLLDRMMGGMSEMVLARNELARRLRDASMDPAVEAALERLSTTVADMRDTVTRTRMQRIEALFASLPRMVRDLAAQTGKQVALSIDGADVELDREMIEMMRDPLVHMIRNAIDHGIEAPGERRAAGKPETGRLSICARQSGNRIIVEISDDGRGIDTARLVSKLAAREPARAPALAALGERAKLDLVFEPGLSSADHVTSLSGRGVGMDVVRANVEQIGGRICLDNQIGRGLTVSVEVPLTLAILSAVVVSVGDQRFAVPRQAVEEILSMRGGAIRVDAVGDARLATVRERRLPLVGLAPVLGCTSAAEPAMLVIVDVPGGAFALEVDGVLDTEELVVKPAPPAIMSAGVYAGQTLPDNGVPMLLLDCAGVAARAGLSFRREQVVEAVPVEVAEPPPEALVFEDLDGRRRALALAAVDRIDRVPVADVLAVGGMWRMLVDGRTVPLVANGPLPECGTVAVLRLHDPAGEIGYIIRSAADIVPLHASVVPAQGEGPVLGVTVIGDEALEVLDPLWILGRRPAAAPAGKPSFRLDGDEAEWMSAFLAPVLEAAGYRRGGAEADVVLTMDDEGARDPRTLRLSRDPERGVYCYDRAGLVAAVAAQAGLGRAGIGR